MKKLSLTAAVALALLGLGGNEIPRGPGLLSGSDGEFVLRTGSIGASTSTSTGSAAPRDAAEEREYQEWREWKRRQGTQ